MSQTVDIGAARINLVVDASDYEPVLNRLKNTAADFGSAAEAAFDRSSGKARTAANRLLDYVATLGRAESQLERMVRQASRAGVEAPVIAAAVTEYKKYEAQLKAVEVQQRKVAAAFDEASKINVAFDNDRGQRAQFDINRQLGVVERDAAEQAKRRLDAESALLPVLQRQEREYEQMVTLAHQINNARDEQLALNSQRSFNSQLGVQDGARSPAYLAEQRRIVELFNQQAIAEQAVEAEARDIHAQWVAIERQIQSVGKSTYDIMRANVQQRFGANGAPLIDQINKWEKLNTTMSGATVNAKQLQQAVRFLPAQFTDIGVSLAGGMNPLLVAFQQGGQILDQFRLAGAKTGDTFRIIGQYAMRLVNPVTVGIGVIAGLSYAAYAAAKAMEDLAVATAKGMGVAGSAQDLYALTESLNKLENVRLGPAEQAVARLAAGGRLAGENFDLAAEATARWSSLTGEAADRVAGQFEAIGKDPLQAIESGLVRVTQAQYDHIRALVAQGNEQQAVNDLTRIWYDAINGQSSNVEAHLTTFGNIIRSISSGFGDATRSAANFFNTSLNMAVDTAAKLARLNIFTAPFSGPIAGLIAKPDVEGAVNAAFADSMRFVTQAQINDAKKLDSIKSALATKEEQRVKDAIELYRLYTNGTIKSHAELDKLLAANDEKYKDKNKRTGAGGTGARTAARDVRYDYQLESAMLQTQTREVQAAYAIKKISAESYYKSLLSFAQKEFDIQKRSNAEQLAAIGGKKGQEHEVARLRVADAIAEQQLAQRTIDIQSQQAQYMRQLEQERRNYTNSLRDGVQAQQEEFDVALARLTMGDREFERWSATNELRREEARLLRDISRQQEDGAITSEEAERRKQEAIQATIDKLAQTAGMYGRIDAAQADWAVGASKAWKNWQDEVADVATHSERFMTQALEGFADATTDMLAGNMDSWGDYFDGLARMITQFIVKQKLTDWIKSLSAQQAGGGGGGGLMGFLGSLAGALFGGGGAGIGSAPTGGQFSWAGAGYADGGQIPARSMREVNERGFEMANIGSKQYLLTGSRPVQITPNHKMGGQSQITKQITIVQNNKFDMASDKTTRDQYRREQAGATQKAMNKV